MFVTKNMSFSYKKKVNLEYIYLVYFVYIPIHSSTNKGINLKLGSTEFVRRATEYVSIYIHT